MNIETMDLRNKIIELEGDLEQAKIDKRIANQMLAEKTNRIIVLENRLVAFSVAPNTIASDLQKAFTREHSKVEGLKQNVSFYKDAVKQVAELGGLVIATGPSVPANQVWVTRDGRVIAKITNIKEDV